MADALYEQVRCKLRVTWEDEATAARIRGVIANAEHELRDMLGIPDEEEFDFAEAGTENSLLLDYCRYEWWDRSEEFEANYGPKVARCREKWMVRQYEAEQAADAE